MGHENSVGNMEEMGREPTPECAELAILFGVNARLGATWVEPTVTSADRQVNGVDKGREDSPNFCFNFY